MPPKRMTANPVKPARYRPGKIAASDHSSSEEDEASEVEEVSTSAPPSAPPPKATSFPLEATKITSNLQKVDLNERRRQAAIAEVERVEAEKVARAEEEEGFVTEESSAEEGSASGSEESGSEEEESSEDEAPKVLLRPTFLKKEQRKDVSIVAAGSKTEDERWAEEERRRKEKADAMIQDQLDKDAAARAAGKKYWDDDEEGEGDMVDDTDGLDPEGERALWKLRELKRVKRDREAIEEAEKEREELERRRNLSKEEREAEDKLYIEHQKEENSAKGKMTYLQKYHHKGAFFQDDAKEAGLDRRDIMGARFQDDGGDRELLPQYMQIRDMTKLGRKGRTKYRDLKSEDTGRWGEEKRGTRDGGLDERFRPDRGGPSGANATVVRERRVPEGAPTGPRDKQQGVRRGDVYVPDRSGRDEDKRPSPRRNSYERSQSPPRRRRSYSWSSTPSRRRRYSYSRSRIPTRRRRYAESRSRTPSPPRERYRERRKRSPSPYCERRDGDKRQRLSAV